MLTTIHLRSFRLSWILLSSCLFSVAGFAQAPTISVFRPVYAAAGEDVVIDGTNFSGATAVRFGTVPAASFVVESSTRIRAVVGAGASGSVTVSKTGFADASRAGFTFSTISTVTQIITDFGGFWSTNTITNNPVFPNDNHNLLAYRYKGVLTSTGVNDAALSANGEVFVPGSFKALPVTLNGLSSAPPLYLATASRIDGNTAAALFTSPAIKDLTIQSVLTDGPNGLNLGTGYTNLPVTASSDFPVRSILPIGINDGVPDFLISQVADPSSSLFDTYRFLDAAGNVVGTPVLINFSQTSALGTYFLDLFTVPLGVPFSAAKPTGVFQTNTTRPIRMLAFDLADFGINNINFAQIRRFQILPSGVSDLAFAAYNVNNINVPPSIEVDVLASSTNVCAGQASTVTLAIIATAASGGALTYVWEESTNGGLTWNPVTNGGNYSGATTSRLQVTNATAGFKYRCQVTEAGGFSETSDDFTINEVVSAPLSGTLNPAPFTACLNANSGTTSLSVNPTGGSGTYTYQWSTSTTVNGVYTDIPGAVNNSYSPPLAPVGELFYRVRIQSGCFDVLSNPAAVTINGAEITGTVPGTRCSAGTVPLAATASGGTISWFTTATSTPVLTTGNTYTTPSLSASTTYFVSTTLGSCISARVPVLAQVTSSIALNTSNFNIIFASDVCAGTASLITLSTSALVNGLYTVTYNIAGANPITGATAIMLVQDGIGTFATNALSSIGSNTITITSVAVPIVPTPTVGPTSCNVAPTSGNTEIFNVNAGAPNASNISVGVNNGCINVNSVATVTSSTLASGTYLVTYDVTGANTLSSRTAQMVFTAGAPGTGTFTLPLLPNTVGSNQLQLNSISLLSSPSCVSSTVTSPSSFINSQAATIDAGSNLSMCGSDPAFNITVNASASSVGAMFWFTSGTGTFTNNNTANALSSTTYQPSAADISAGSVTLVLAAAGLPGCANQESSFLLSIASSTIGGIAGPDQMIDINTLANDLSLTSNVGSVLRWERSLVNTFSPATNIPVTTTTLTGSTMGPIGARTFFRAIVKNGACPEEASDFATINIRQILPAIWAYSKLSCNEGKVQLEWSTLSEQNTRQFIVQKSTEPGIWSNIGSVPAARQSQRQLYYSFTDAKHFAGIRSFYRIVLNDLDGTQTFSQVMVADCQANDGGKIVLQPNPAKEIVRLSNLKKSGTIRIVNNLGKEVLPMVQYNRPVVEMSLGLLPAGTYFIIIQSAEETTTQVLVKE